MPDPPTAPTPPVETGHADWDSYLCGAGVVLCDAIAKFADELAAINPALGIAVTGVTMAAMVAWASVTAGTGLLIALAIAGGIVAALPGLIDLGVDASLQIIANEFRTNTNLRNCISTAVKLGDGWEGKKALVLEAIDAKYAGHSSTIPLAKLMVLDIWMQEIVNGRNVDGVAVFPTTPVGVPCDCITEPALPDAPSGWVWVPVEINSLGTKAGTVDTDYTVGGNYARYEGSVGGAAGSNVQQVTNTTVPAGTKGGMWISCVETYSGGNAGSIYRIPLWDGQSTAAFAAIATQNRRSWQRFVYFSALLGAGDAAVLSQFGENNADETATDNSATTPPFGKGGFEIAYYNQWPLITFDVHIWAYYLVKQ
jgi:hypothetical protein